MASILLRAGAALALGTASAAIAAPTIDPAYGDHAVIQRGRPIHVSGTAAPGETVTVTFGDARASGRAGADGRYLVTLPPRAAGTGLALTVAAPSGQAVARDILIGDVFLCSGQSNMELEVERAQDGFNQARGSADDQLRLMTIAKHIALTPQHDFAERPQWRAAGPASVPTFSAACFYMVQELRKSSGVPVGAIADSWGGTAISAWMGEAAQRATGKGAQVDLLRLYARDPAAAARASGAEWERWWRARTGDAPGREPWQPDAALAWRPVPKIGFWETWGVPELADYNGMVWFRTELTLTPAQAREAAVLAIGPVDDMDRTWVNGVPVGAGGNPGTPREYPLSAGTLRPGRNVITVNANDTYAFGGMPGPAEAMQLRLADGTRLPLGSGWQYAIEHRSANGYPRPPWDDVAGTGTIFNAMIAPLGSLGLKGVAWYQGEADVGNPGYADRLAAMMAEWRRQFGIADLPFAIVELSSYGTPSTRPGPSGWAELRDEQRRAAARDPHAALAVTIDLGDPLDIHPGEKHEVGRRLARAMRVLAYGVREPASGPELTSATALPDGGVQLRFAGVTGGLHTRSSDRAIGFELCGADQASCRYALGTVSGDTVLLAGDGRPVSRVRYGWSDVPVVNLFDAAPLPAGPFEVAVAAAR